MNRQSVSRLWISPPKYWQATAHMTPRESEDFAAMIEDSLEAGDIEFVKKFPFVSFSDPTTAWRAARKKDKEHQ